MMFKVLVLQTLYTLSDDQTEYQSEGPALVHALFGARARGPGAGRQDHLVVPRAADPGWRHRAPVRQVRCRPARRRLPRHGRADRGRDRGRGPPAEAHRGREGDGQERRRARSLVAGEAGADGHRRPLDDQARAASARRGAGEPQARVAAAIAVPVFGYKNHLGIDRRHGFIRRFAVTDAATHDGRQLGRLLDPDNTASAVWADSAYRSAANARCWRGAGWCPSSSGRSRAASRCRRTSPAATPPGRGSGSPMEHVFAAQKCRLGLVIRSVGLARATTRLGLANLVTNMRRLVWFETRAAPA